MPDYDRDQALHESIGWLVSAVGRDFMLEQVERADRSEGAEVIAAQLRDWTERLSPDGAAEDACRRFRIRRAADALKETAGLGVWEEGESEKWAEVALRGAGVIR